jgi:type III restriction enzyme
LSTASFYECPILNSPYEAPSRHHALDEDGQPLDQAPLPGRRESKFLTPVPKAKKRRGRPRQDSFVFQDEQGLSTADQEYNPTPIINEIRAHVASWRILPNPADWSVTPTTARLLQHWRHHPFQGVRPFFCQVEAIETLIWLTEVAPRQKRYAHILDHLRSANENANPELFRLAAKMATGSGKTTVMAMIIAWQTVNAVRSSGSASFSRGFLLVAPGITIRDRLRVLLPEDVESYYRSREILPSDMLGDIGRAKIVITNYHAFRRRETLGVSKVGRSLLQGRGEALQTLETEGQMLKRACGDLLELGQKVVVINDEAHHCYRARPRSEDEDGLTGDDRTAAERNNEAAGLWISGLEALKRKVGVRAVYDLSATPFFLQGSGYVEGTLFPWTVSDFSLMDAIESGIVKLPRVPVADNSVTGETPIYRKLWDHIGKKMPKKRSGKAGSLDPLSLPNELKTALYALYGHYEKTAQAWQQAGITVPPVFIVVCDNTTSSKLVYEWISGYERSGDDGETSHFQPGHLAQFRNYDEYGNRLGVPSTLLIDSEQLESGDALDPSFRELAGPQIEQFRHEMAIRQGSGALAETIPDQALLREVMNTVGKPGRLGEGIRCVVSVSMLTEGWDTNTVTHILGARAFGTQLLCEQVIGRALRRQSYELGSDGLFACEYADILGIDFDFAAKPVVVKPTKPKALTRIQAVKERSTQEITFPRVAGYRVELPEERLTAEFNADSTLVLTPAEVGPCTVLLSGIVGESVELNAGVLDMIRPNQVAYHLAKHLLYTRLRDPGQPAPMHLFYDAKRIARAWVDGGYLVAKGVPLAAVTYLELADQAVERIYLACQRTTDTEKRIKAILDPYNPQGSTQSVNFTTSKDTYATAPSMCHVNAAVLDSNWEAELARVLERHPRVRAYVKNQGLGFEVPYRDGAVPRRYLPDFIVQVDDGNGEGDLLNLVLETKGQRTSDAQLKAETMRTFWIPGINNLGSHGRWAFDEFEDVFGIEAAFDSLIDSHVVTKKAA